VFRLVQASHQWFGGRILQGVYDWRDQKLHEAGAACLAQSRALAPKKTGFLASQETYQVANGTLTLILGASYDIFQEFGTRNIHAHPHVRPALNAVGRIFGAVEMQFAAPFIASPVLAHKGSYVVPKNLTQRQRRHVAQDLLPVAQRLHRGNVRRAKFRVRRHVP
jgi:hypothetical protein